MKHTASGCSSPQHTRGLSKTKSKPHKHAIRFRNRREQNARLQEAGCSGPLEHNKTKLVCLWFCCQEGAWLVHQEESNYQALQLLSMPQPVTALSPTLPGMSPQGKLRGSAHNGHRWQNSASHQAPNRGILKSHVEARDSRMADRQVHVRILLFLCFACFPFDDDTLAKSCPKRLEKDLALGRN